MSDKQTVYIFLGTRPGYDVAEFARFLADKLALYEIDCDVSATQSLEVLAGARVRSVSIGFTEHVLSPDGLISPPVPTIVTDRWAGVQIGVAGPPHSGKSLLTDYMSYLFGLRDEAHTTRTSLDGPSAKRYTRTEVERYLSAFSDRITVKIVGVILSTHQPLHKLLYPKPGV